MMDTVMDYRSQASNKFLQFDFYNKVKRMESSGCLGGGEKKYNYKI